MKKILSSIIFAAFLLSVAPVFAQGVLLQEDFTIGVFPTGWTKSQATGSDSWKVGSASSLSSGNFNIPGTSNIIVTNDDKCNCDKSIDYLVTPVIDLTFFTNVYLALDVYFLKGTYTQKTEAAKIEVSIDGGTSWADFYTFSGSTSWQNLMLNFTQFAGKGNVKIRFNYNDGGGWLYGLALDNILLYEPTSNDVQLVNVTFPQYLPIGYHTLTGTLINRGLNTVNSLDVSWTLNNTTKITATIDNLNVQTGEEYTFSHPIKLEMLEPVVYDVDVQLSNPNGNPDGDTTNNSFTASTTALKGIPTKNVLIEQYTGQWCGWCPDGSYRLQQILDANPHAVAYAIHAQGGDAMQVPVGSTLANEYVSGFPAGTIDRHVFEALELNRGVWAARFAERSSHIVPVAIEASNTYDSTSRVVTVDMKAIFTGPAEGDFRFNVVVVEDSVSGTGSGYNQVNYFSNNSNYQNHPFYSYPNPIVGYQHRHVMRAMVGGAWGQDVQIPAQVSADDEFNHQFTYTLPSNYNSKRITLVAMVQLYDTDKMNRPILNSVHMNLNDDVSIDIEDVVLSAQPAQAVSDLIVSKVFPNPSTGLVNLVLENGKNQDVKIEVYNMMGQQVKGLYTGNLEKGNYNITWDAADTQAGFYFINVSVAGKTSAHRVVLVK